ncbi:MAG: helix-hairpin-helix domain-containing protein [Deltaproteobacteria bacterium]|nr:helix-hairpin-helix domain-containing protein [Deltaproteobacteria bacterium]
MQIKYLSRVITIGLIFGLSVIVSNPLTALGEEQPGINLNTASSFKLVKIPVISIELSASIVNHRSKYGPFKTPEDLLKVPGMTQEILEEIHPQVDQNGDLISTSAAGIELDETMVIPHY